MNFVSGKWGSKVFLNFNGVKIVTFSWNKEQLVFKSVGWTRLPVFRKKNGNDCLLPGGKIQTGPEFTRWVPCVRDQGCSGTLKTTSITDLFNSGVGKMTIYYQKEFRKDHFHFCHSRFLVFWICHCVGSKCNWTERAKNGTCSVAE